MLKQDIKILLVEDDESLGRSLEESFKRAGYSCRWVSSADDALTAFKISDFSVIILDCMLPKINGVQLAQSLRQTGGKNFKIFLISGIFRDRSFINDAVYKTQASGFFSKPFDHQAIVGAVDNAFAESLEPEREPLFLLMSKDAHSPRERLKALDKTEVIHGFDLPFVFSLLIGAPVSGHLNILTAEGGASSVAIADGKIAQVSIDDKTSYFGVLLVEHGFTSDEEVSVSLSRPSAKPIGERLVEASALSPHAIQIIRREQLAIRLSKTIQDTSMQIRFLEQPVNDGGGSVDSSEFSTLLNDWIVSKLTLSWLRAYYTPWLDYSLRFGHERSRYEMVQHLPLLKMAGPLLKQINNDRTLQEILNRSDLNEDKILKVIHFLMVERILVFSTRQQGGLVDFESKRQRLNTLFKELKNQNHFEILGVSENAQDREINRSYVELAKALHPDKLDPQAPEDLKQLQQQIFSRIAEAYDILRDRGRRELYVKELHLGQADELIRNEALFEEALALLHRGQYQKALKILQTISTYKAHRSDLLIYQLWAKIKLGTPSRGMEKFIEEIGYELNQIPPEGRHTPIYIFVKGLYLKLIGRFDKAYTYFKHATTMDPSMTMAKREMVALEGDSRRSSTNDLTSVVGMLFHNKGKQGRKNRK